MSSGVRSASGVLPSGAKTSSISSFQRLDENTLSWQSNHRTLGPQGLPDTGEHGPTGVALRFLENLVTRIDELPTKNYAIQVYGRVDLGATRTEEELVVEILCDETK